MHTLQYDGTFEGWLCVVFEVYERRMTDVNIVEEQKGISSLFGSIITTSTDETKARRVWQGICKKVSVNAAKQLYRSFLSEEQGREDILLSYARYALASKQSIEYDYAHPAVRYVIDTDKKIRREKHRMEAFVRFALTGDGIYYATIAPDFNVLPLIRPHFEKRYADQPWLIYDTHRKYGIYYDLDKTWPVTIEPASVEPAADPFTTEQTEPVDQPLTIFTPDEAQYQDLWRHYFQKVNIPARKNSKLHLRHMPTRYWKYLPEKRPT